MFKNNKLNLKTPKKRKRTKFKYLIYLLIIYFSICLTFYLSMRKNKDNFNEEFIIFLLEGGSIDELNQYKFPNLVNKTVNYFLKITTPGSSLPSIHSKKAPPAVEI